MEVALFLVNSGVHGWNVTSSYNLNYRYEPIYPRASRTVYTYSTSLPQR